MRQPKRNLLSGRRFGYDGMLWWNSYDRKRAAGLTLQQSLNRYLDADMLAKAGNRRVPGKTRAKAYFSRTLLLLNRNNIRPLIVVMPYHPRVRKAFMSVGWGVKQRALNNYLKKLRKYRNFRVINCLDIKTFGGSRQRLLRRGSPHRGKLAAPHPLPRPQGAGMLPRADAGADAVTERIAQPERESERQAGFAAGRRAGA